MAGGERKDLNMPTDLNLFKIGDTVEMVNFSGFYGVHKNILGLEGAIWEVTEIISIYNTNNYLINIRNPFTQRVIGPYYASRFIRV